MSWLQTNTAFLVEINYGGKKIASLKEKGKGELQEQRLQDTSLRRKESTQFVRSWQEINSLCVEGTRWSPNNDTYCNSPMKEKKKSYNKVELKLG